MNYRMDHAVDFLYRNARLLDRLLYEVRLCSADPAQLLTLVKSYQNPDGGIGNAIEPDIRCGASQPLSTETGLLALFDAGVRCEDLSLSVCRYMQSVSDESRLVPMLLPSAFGSPLAPHWTGPGPAGVNPTAGICGLLHWQNIEHPWLSLATKACRDLLLNEPHADAHALLSAARLAENIPDITVADMLVDRIAEMLPKARFFIPNAPVTSYGLTPLDFAPTPSSRWRSLFTDAQILGHLRHLSSLQADDGGWPISWKTVSDAATAEWRGRGTLNAMITLSAYDESWNV